MIFALASKVYSRIAEGCVIGGELVVGAADCRPQSESKAEFFRLILQARREATGESAGECTGGSTGEIRKKVKF